MIPSSPPNQDVTILGVLAAFFMAIGMFTGFFAWFPASVPNPQVQGMAGQIASVSWILGLSFFGLGVFRVYWKKH